MLQLLEVAVKLSAELSKAKTGPIGQTKMGPFHFKMLLYLGNRQKEKMSYRAMLCHPVQLLVSLKSLMSCMTERTLWFSNKRISVFEFSVEVILLQLPVKDFSLYIKPVCMCPPWLILLREPRATSQARVWRLKSIRSSRPPQQTQPFQVFQPSSLSGLTTTAKWMIGWDDSLRLEPEV